MISWMSRRQDSVVLSSVEVEYVAACEVGKEAVWLRKLLAYLFEKSLLLNFHDLGSRVES